MLSPSNQLTTSVVRRLNFLPLVTIFVNLLSVLTLWTQIFLSYN